MRNDPVEKCEQRDVDEETTEEAQRIAAFHAKCAAMRQVCTTN